MTANAARAVKATRELVNAVPFLGGSDSEAAGNSESAGASEAVAPSRNV